MTSIPLALLLLAGASVSDPSPCAVRLEVQDGSGAPLPGATVTPVVTQGGADAVLTVSDTTAVACLAEPLRLRVELPGSAPSEIAAVAGTQTIVLAPGSPAAVEVARERRDARLRDVSVRTGVVSRAFVERAVVRAHAAPDWMTGVRVRSNPQAVPARRTGRPKTPVRALTGDA